MKKSLIVFVAVTSLIVHNVVAQSANAVHGVVTVLKKGYELIPVGKINDSTNAVFQQLSMNSQKQFYRQKSLSWYCANIDGHYCMKINPEQIYFYTSHENPNPNILFWVLPLQKGQYNTVVRALPHLKAKLAAIKLTPDSLETGQIKYIFDWINRANASGTYPLDYSKRIVFPHTVFISFSPEFIEDWMKIREVDVIP